MANVYFGDTIGQADQNWNTSIQFTVAAVTVAPTAGATYTNNGITFKVTSASITAGSGTINAGGTGTSLAAGVLTKVSGTGDATIAFSAKADVNWFSDPGSVGGCCACTNVPGTPLGRLPTLADSVIVNRTISIGPDITPWTTDIFSYVLYTANGGVTYGAVNAGTFNGTVKITNGSVGGSIVCNGAVQTFNADGTINGGTFNGAVTSITSSNLYINGGVFTSTVTVGTSSPTIFARLIITGGTFNGTVLNPSGSSTRMNNLIYITGSPVFNCAIPSTFGSVTLAGGTYDRDLVLGVVSPTLGSPPTTSGSTNSVSIQTGLSTSRNITIYCNGISWNSYTGLYSYGSVTIGGGVLTGLLTINKLSQVPITVTGGSYSPPAVTTPAIKSGNNMTFSSAAIPTDWGFRAGGGTFSPTILLSGTSNDIIGSGLP
jgi:hypothetical protein